MYCQSRTTSGQSSGEEILFYISDFPQILHVSSLLMTKQYSCIVSALPHQKKCPGTKIFICVLGWNRFRFHILTNWPRYSDCRINDRSIGWQRKSYHYVPLRYHYVRCTIDLKKGEHMIDFKLPIVTEKKHKQLFN